MDRFDDIWRNTFQGSLPEHGPWDTPKDDVWFNLEKKMKADQGKKRRRFVWLWFSYGMAGFLALSAALWIGFYSGDSNKDILILSEQLPQSFESNATSGINLSKNPIESFGAASEISKENVIKVSSKVLLKSKDKGYTRVPENINSSIDHNYEDIYSTLFNENAHSQSTGSKAEIIVNRNFIDQNSIDQNTSQEKTVDVMFHSFSKDASSISRTRTLDESFLAANPKNVDEADHVPSIKDSMSARLSEAHQLDLQTKHSSNKKRSWIFGLELGYNYWTQNISKSMSSDLSPFNFNWNSKSGYTTNLFVGKSISNSMEFRFGFSYEYASFQSGHNGQLNYSRTMEQSGENSNMYDINLATTFGTTPAVFRMLRHEDIQEYELGLNVDYHSNHTLHMVGIPVQIIYYPFNKSNRIKPLLGLGIQANWVSNFVSDINYINCYRPEFSYSGAAVVGNVLNNINRFQFFGSAQFGMQYIISPLHTLIFRYEFGRGLNPVYAENQHINRLDRHLLGLTYQLNLFKVSKI
jgi:hypothetical protein